MINAILLGVVLTGIIVVYGQPILAPLVFAAMISFALFPVVRFLKQYISEFFAIVVSILLFILLSGSVCFIITSELFQLSIELSNIKLTLTQNLNTIKTFLQQYISTKYIFEGEYINFIAENYASWISQLIFQTIWQGGTIIVTAIFIIFYMFYMLYYRDHFKDGFFYLLGRKDRTNNMIYATQKAMSGYLLGIFNIMLILFFFNLIGLWFIGLPYPFLWATIGSVGYIVPFVGIIIAVVLPALFALVTAKTLYTALFVIILFLASQMLENNVLTPYIVGNHIHMNPLVLLVAVVVGGYAWGVTGMILFVPLLSIVQIICAHFPQTRPIEYLMKHPTRSKE